MALVQRHRHDEGHVRGVPAVAVDVPQEVEGELPVARRVVALKSSTFSISVDPGKGFLKIFALISYYKCPQKYINAGATDHNTNL